MSQQPDPDKIILSQVGNRSREDAVSRSVPARGPSSGLYVTKAQCCIRPISMRFPFGARDGHGHVSRPIAPGSSDVQDNVKSLKVASCRDLKSLQMRHRPNLLPMWCSGCLAPESAGPQTCWRARQSNRRNQREMKKDIQFIICNLRISAQFSVPIGRKAKEFHLLLHIDPDVVPEEVVVGHVPVLHGKHAGSKDPEEA